MQQEKEIKVTVVWFKWNQRGRGYHHYASEEKTTGVTVHNIYIWTFTNPLNPKVNIQILHTSLHTFLERLLERIF